MPVESREYGQLFGGTDLGMRVLEDIKDGFHYSTPMFQPGLDPLTLAFREGQRSVAIWLTQTVKAALEAEEREVTYNSEVEDARSSS